MFVCDDCYGECSCGGLLRSATALHVIVTTAASIRPKGRLAQYQAAKRGDGAMMEKTPPERPANPPLDNGGTNNVLAFGKNRQ